MPAKKKTAKTDAKETSVERPPAPVGDALTPTDDIRQDYDGPKPPKPEADKSFGDKTPAVAAWNMLYDPEACLRARYDKVNWPDAMLQQIAEARTAFLAWEKENADVL